jgi:anti-sigma B factor antagonist
MTTRKAITQMIHSVPAEKTTDVEGLMIETISSRSGFLIKVWGKLDWMGAVTLRHVVHDSLQPGMQMVIDLGHVDAIDAVGISALVGTLRRVRATGGTARISNVPARLRRYVDFTGVGEMLTSSVALNGDSA